MGEYQALPDTRGIANTCYVPSSLLSNLMFSGKNSNIPVVQWKAFDTETGVRKFESCNDKDY